MARVLQVFPTRKQLIFDTDHFSTRLRRSWIFSRLYNAFADTTAHRLHLRTTGNIPTRSGSRKLFRHDRREAKTIDPAKGRVQKRAPHIKTEHHFVR